MQRRQHMQPVPASVRRPTSFSVEAEKTSIACSTSWRVTFRQRHKTSFWLTGIVRYRKEDRVGKENRAGGCRRIREGRELNLACVLRLSLNVSCIVPLLTFDVKNFSSSFIELCSEIETKSWRRSQFCRLSGEVGAFGLRGRRTGKRPDLTGFSELELPYCHALKRMRNNDQQGAPSYVVEV